MEHAGVDNRAIRTRRVLVITNARATRVQRARHVTALTTALHAAGMQIIDAPTRSLGALDQTLTSLGVHRANAPYTPPAGRPDLIALVGGDGSVRALAERLIDDGPPVLIVPGGGGNYLHRELARTITSRPLATRVRSPHTALITVARISSLADAPSHAPLPSAPAGVAMTLMAGVGLDGWAAAATPRWLKAVSPHLAYGVGISSAWMRQAVVGPQITFAIDGVDQPPAAWVMVTNARFAGASRLCADPTSAPSAPHMHVVAVRPRHMGDTADVLWRLANAAVIRAPHVSITACRSVDITGPVSMPVHADGERPAATPVRITAWRRMPVLL